MLIGEPESGAMLLGEIHGERLGESAQAASPAGAIRAPAKAAIGGVIRGYTAHGLHQKVSRGVSSSAVLDAVKNPLKVGEVVFDSLGRPSQRYTGEFASVVVNPKSGNVVSVNPTSTKHAQRLKRRKEEKKKKDEEED